MSSSSRTPRKSETAATPKTNGGRSAAKEKKSVDRSKQPRGKETARKEEDGGGKGVSKGRAKEGGGAVKGGEKKGEKQSRVQTKGRASTGSQKLDAPITRRNSMGAGSSARKKKENAVDGNEKLSIKGEKQVARKNDKKEEENEGGRRKSSVNSSVENKSRSVISMSQVKTSTPKRNIPRISSSIGKENAVARYNVSASNRDYSVKSDVSMKGIHRAICASTDLNNNNNNSKENKIEKKMEASKETGVAKLEHKTMILGKIEEETMVASKEISRISMNQKTLTSSCKKEDKKEASTGKQGLHASRICGCNG